ncbi:chorismate synthase [Desulforamulus reducens MI-1]|uniref:Chorismate synthase n=1 Tax=Desulforamulus reducens (strain ATCC BAA-1160 / DSM 100696 / MI-1) TaxID=349161 RepID=AROC_DESRM|nr:chorismate synthase [Desulforamulus reducens]A4J3A1.1 RecName: Full=Chorismate synthase; Short=CS; AltName: Full=5-enolpyruvylshikimate-3-phosphate phospholyase [Desulforamulus reducens MI-1]ABO49554.1 chorismate synthase [Desulforamulus reducens MI-1]
MLRFLTAGESHGPALTAIVEGMVAGLPVTHEYINTQLARRQGGYGRGGRMKIEKDEVQFLSGIRGGYTTGSPITLQIANRDWQNWCHIMASGPDALLDERVVTRPRPGHADLPGAIKYDHSDIRNILERSSARETAARVAVGSMARCLLEELDIKLVGFVCSIGSIKASVAENLSIEDLVARTQSSQLFCPDEQAEEAMVKEIDQAKETGDSLGGVFEVRVYGVPVGLGSHVQWDRKLDSRLAGAMMGIQAIKGVEIGLGFGAAAVPGSQVHDEIYYAAQRGFYRGSNRAGGIEGGITNGEPLILRAAMKPIPTLYKPLRSVDIKNKEPYLASVERSDVCAVPAACVVGEAVVAWELAVALMEKFGGDSLGEIKARLNQWQQWVRQV